jgi:ureidoacrylate peracid hydrolase
MLGAMRRPAHIILGWADANLKGHCEALGTAGAVPACSAPTRRRAEVAGVLGYGHMLLMVEDMERSVAFYARQLGFTIRPAKPLQDGRPFTAFRQGIALVSGRAPGHRQVDHIAFEVDDLRAVRDRLQAKGVPFFQDLHDGPYGLTIYVANPDGTKVELYQVGASAAA